MDKSESHVSSTAPLWRRALAGVIDLLIYIPILVPASIAGSILFSEPENSTLGQALVVGWIYGTPAAIWVMLLSSGSSPGERALSIRVVSKNGREPTSRQRVIRRTVLLFGIAIFGLGLLSIVLSPNRRGLHDLMAGTAIWRQWPSGYCQACGYDLWKSTGTRCPECGMEKRPR